ncbi:ABC transporter substrate-binding protein [Catenovulum adriaticum]|uniref:ABC transporter substrate-binding protein n=1 Tax=Catenovulum adriaticum TaxID=2984846 RepID=A0ABY7AQZ3_9ALTE|nr:ABC transporter substrate-binding protein [Catenovulum sp. TS8]WAJ71904.1 ABC transporter substrate-binding protein [Catenovulum sp. TS8]
MFNKLVFTAILTVLLSPPCLAINVLFINPDIKGRVFWDLTTDVAKQAADQLGINLIVKYGGGNRFSNQILLEQIEGYYDYVVFFPHSGNAVQSFKVLSQLGIPFITLERSISQDELELLKKTSSLYPLWIGEVFYDDAQAGALLANKLITLHRKKSQAQPQILAFNGDYSQTSSNRSAGLITAAASKQAKVLQVLHTMWKPEQAQYKLNKALKRYPNANIIWTASDQLAIAISDQLNINRANILVGGIDWSPKAIGYVENKQLSAVVGGHFMQAAWALVLVYDHFKGVDISMARKAMPLQHQTIDSTNIDKLANLKNTSIWRCFNFSNFSIDLNSQIDTYKFDFTDDIEHEIKRCLIDKHQR